MKWKPIESAAWITPEFDRPVDFSERGAGFIEGFASACASMSYALCGYPDCGKSYDPMTVCLRRGQMSSYVFNMKDGGRGHPLVDYASYREIADVLLAETIEDMTQDAADISHRLLAISQAIEARRAETATSVGDTDVPETPPETNP